MREGPDISQIGALIGDPARANILVALMDGRALTATELAEIAGVTAQTASTHLSKLAAGGLIRPQKQGRHKYFSLAGPKAGQLIESLSIFAADRGHLRHRPGPRDAAMRKARVIAQEIALFFVDASTSLLQLLPSRADRVRRLGRRAPSRGGAEIALVEVRDEEGLGAGVPCQRPITGTHHGALEHRLVNLD